RAPRPARWMPIAIGAAVVAIAALAIVEGPSLLRSMQHVGGTGLAIVRRSSHAGHPSLAQTQQGAQRSSRAGSGLAQNSAPPGGTNAAEKLASAFVPPGGALF